MQVIYQTIPNFEYFSQSQKRLLLACFEAKRFMAGATIFPEGSEPKHAFLICEGEVRIYSELDPSQMRIRDNGQVAIAKKPHEVLQQQINYECFNSPLKRRKNRTHDQFHFSLKAPGMWVGEDCLILGQGAAFPFGAAATKSVLALRISRHDMTVRLPYAYQQNLMQEAHARQQWLQVRVKQIHHTVDRAKRVNSEFTKKDRAEFEYKRIEYKEEIEKAHEMRQAYLSSTTF